MYRNEWTLPQPLPQLRVTLPLNVGYAVRRQRPSRLEGVFLLKRLARSDGMDDALKFALPLLLAGEVRIDEHGDRASWLTGFEHNRENATLSSGGVACLGQQMLTAPPLALLDVGRSQYKQCVAAAIHSPLYVIQER
jgi:hypothetical protein